MTKKEIKEFFEEHVLKGTCFESLSELQKDKSDLATNAVRALIAVNLLGVWRGMQIMNELNKENKAKL